MRKLKLNHDYGGRLTKDRRISPGIYDEADPALFGIAEHLIEAGEAAWIEVETIEEIVTPPEPEPLPYFDPVDKWTMTPPDPEPVDYDRMTAPVLQDLARERGIFDAIEGTGANGRVTKQDLIAALEANDFTDED